MTDQNNSDIAQGEKLEEGEIKNSTDQSGDQISDAKASNPDASVSAYPQMRQQAKQSEAQAYPSALTQQATQPQQQMPSRSSHPSPQHLPQQQANQPQAPQSQATQHHAPQSQATQQQAMQQQAPQQQVTTFGATQPLQQAQTAAQTRSYAYYPNQPQPQPQPQPQAFTPMPAHTPVGTHAPTLGQTWQNPSQSTSVATATARPTVSRSPQKSEKKQSKLALFLVGMLSVFVGALITAGVFLLVIDIFDLNGSGSEPTTALTTPAAEVSTSDGTITISPISEDATLPEVVAAKALPSVVNIDVYASYDMGGIFGDSAPNSGSDSTDNLEEYGLGSGVILSEDGYILTNYHVVEGGEEFLVRLDSATQYKATLVDADESSDLAVLKVDATGLTPIEIADSNDIAVGEWVMALGSPFGLEKSVSTGIVSATLRSTTMESTTGVNVYANMIQTDAAINPGNSGGALVNAEGKLIGINTLIASDSGNSSGVGFAIPSNYAIGIAQQIMSGKEVEHAYMGVSLQSVDAGNASSLNSTVESGAYLDSVVPGSPAAQAGLQQGDIVVKMDDTIINSGAELMIGVRGHMVGDKVKLEVIRDGQTQTIEVTLGSDKQA